MRWRRTEGSVTWYMQAYERLATLMAARVRYSNDYDSIHSDEQEDFERWRYDVGDTLLDIASAFRFERLPLHLVAD